MRANRKFISKFSDRAEVGIGTLIVFIAMVLVAAVAAAVLINTSGALQSKASKTGTAATQQVSNTLLVLGKYGKVNSGAIDTVYYEIGLAPGASGIDMDDVKLTWFHSSNRKTLSCDCTTASWAADEFSATWKRGSNTDNMLDAGEMVEVAVDLTGATISTDTSVSAQFYPEGGNPTDASFTTPTTFGSATYVDL